MINEVLNIDYLGIKKNDSYTNMITVYTVAWNEEVILPLMIDFYRKRFPNCRIVVYDNNSTDKTVEISIDNNCEVIRYDTGNQMDELKFQSIKNNCWKEAKTDWVIVCDVDEWFDVYPTDLINRTASVLSFDYYTLISLESGYKESVIAKYGCFDKSKIKEINYSIGCHSCNPIGDVKYSRRVYKMYHYKAFDLKYLLDRYDIYSKRRSKESVINKWGVQYKWSKWKIKRMFNKYQIKSKTIPDLIKNKEQML